MSNIDAIDGDERVKVKIKLLYPHSKMPDKKHPGDAGFDLYAAEDYRVYSTKPALVKTGVAIELPCGYEAQVRCRSGLAVNPGLFAVNGIGTIDADYRGEIGAILALLDDRYGCLPYDIRRGDAIAQLVIKRVPEVCLTEVDELTPSCRGANGYGSTGR